ncbi:capsule assembly Wzi family protein [Sphingobacterium chuzhouense]|uniref:Capsule assembly protein Wzi n=1 Tax=Sphingobacterium chuzhouense TaxID=1742264 RepID=A0ABR7XXL6_9SPHI|nr:capsule assembly Wzi family protein [Sphingobacterium chuzhouense]MBD1423795.1 hypothetical protein [Sphingobacterium chuzhouense]
MNRTRFLVVVFNMFFILVSAQQEVSSRLVGRVETQLGYTSNDAVPLWMRANQFGSVPSAGLSNSWIGSFYKTYRKPYDPNDFSSVDWGLDIQTRINLAEKTSAQLIEGALKGKWWIFEGRAGRAKDIIGLNGDTTLSSGNFAVSGNALGIPKLEIRIPDYYRLPFWDGVISLKGNFVYGWVGRRVVDRSAFRIPSEDYRINSFYHQKSLYGRIGKHDWKLNLYGGINHQAYWGNEKDVYGDKFKLSEIESFLYVFLGRKYYEPGIGSSKLGNQLGSIDMGLSYDFNNIRLFGYRQFFYDVGAISRLANIVDGLTGLTIENLNNMERASNGWIWRKFIFEFFYSKDQAGYPWSKPTKSGDEDYYNNSYYREGWSYKDVGVGSPLIIAASDAKEGQVSNPYRFFISNRVSALHIGVDLQIFETDLLLKATYARHFGNFTTSPWGSSLGRKFREPYGLFVPVSQFSTYLKAHRNLTRGFSMGLVLSADYGNMLNNSVGSYVAIAKQW